MINKLMSLSMLFIFIVTMVAACDYNKDNRTSSANPPSANSPSAAPSPRSTSPTPNPTPPPPTNP